MNGVEKHAEYYRGYLTHDRSLIPLTIALVTVLALWLLIYLVSAVGPQLEVADGPVRAACLRRRLPTRK